MKRFHEHRAFPGVALAAPLVISCLLLAVSWRGVAGQAAAASDAPPDEQGQIALAHPMEIAFYARASTRQVHLMRAAQRELCAHTADHPVRSWGPTIPPDSLDWLCDGSKLRYLSGVQLDGTQVDSGFICDAEWFIELKYNTPNHMENEFTKCVAIYKDRETGHFDIKLK